MHEAPPHLPFRLSGPGLARHFPHPSGVDTLPRMSATPHQPSQRTILFVLAGVFLLTLGLQLPGVMDFQKFGFYDEGAWLRLDQLFAGGRVPTVDLGYSYGMLPLMLSRGWFAIFGRTPWAYLGFMTACNLLSVAAIGVILHAAGSSWRRVGAACVLLPLAVMPNNYSLMHPLEMMLILWALAWQFRGRYGLALVFAVGAVFTKPSMAYVLGLLLLILAMMAQGQAEQKARVPWRLLPRRPPGWEIVLPPVVAGVLLLVVSTQAVPHRVCPPVQLEVHALLLQT